MHILISNYGNESCALLQWAIKVKLQHVVVISVDTGWAADGWLDRVAAGEAFARQAGFGVVRLQSKLSFNELIQDRQSFPNKKFQWCAGFLKGLPILEWLDEQDPACEATLLLATRRATSRANFNLPEFIEESDYYNGRRVWHPLFDQQSIDDLLIDCSLERLTNNRSLECQPCIHSNANEIRQMAAKDVEKTDQLERIAGQPMFPAEAFEQQQGIVSIVDCLKQKQCAAESGNYPDMGCGSPWGCGT